MDEFKTFVFFEETPSNILYGKVEGDSLREFRVINKANKSLMGNIYRGRITKRINNTNTLFVDIGEELNGFLQHKNRDPNSYREGDSIIVQVKSDPHEGKGAILTTDYELRGKYIILQPHSTKTSISKKIYSKAKIGALKGYLKELLDYNGGMMIRSSAEELDDYGVLKNEFQELLTFHEQLKLEENYSPTPKLLLDENDIFNLVIDVPNIPIIVNNKNLKENIIYYNRDLNVILKVDFSTKYIPKLFKEIKSIYERKILLENGLELIFDKTEAFNVIDINTKNYITGNLKNRNLDTANIESVEEILRQINLRNLSGIILVDFINSGSEKRETELLDFIQKRSKEYGNPVNTHGFTKLGILELTRRKSYREEEYTEENFHKIWS